MGSVVAAGQSTQERSYAFSDRSSGASSALYRIVQYDYDGKTTISTIVRGNCLSRGNAVSLYPNPVSASTTLSITLDRAQSVTLSIVDSRGAMVEQRTMLLPSGNTSIPLNVSQYSDGVYSITVQYSQERNTLKLIKK